MEKKPYPVDVVQMQVAPRLDSIEAWWMLKTFPEGEKWFPGISQAKLEFVGDALLGENMSGDRLLTERHTLALGRFGGIFDEHATVSRPARQDESCSTLVAHYLGLDERPEFTLLLKETREEDLSAGKGVLGIPFQIKIRHSLHPDDPMTIIQWVVDWLNDFHEDQRKLFTVGKEQFERLARKSLFRITDDEDGLIVSYQSDEGMYLARYARMAASAAVIIQMNDRGNVQVLANAYYFRKRQQKKRRDALFMDDTAAAIRYAEQKARGSLQTTDWNELRREGVVAGADNWYFHRNGQMMLNGSLTTPDAEPTRLSLSTIVELAVIGLEKSYFPEDRAKDCRRGVCTSAVAHPCDWYDLGLHRCRAIRSRR